MGALLGRAAISSRRKTQGENGRRTRFLRYFRREACTDSLGGRRSAPYRYQSLPCDSSQQAIVMRHNQPAPPFAPERLIYDCLAVRGPKDIQAKQTIDAASDCDDKASPVPP